MRYYISDMHFGSKNIIDLDQRHFQSVEEMDIHMIERWNSKVRPQYDVVILGDIASVKPQEVSNILNKLHGNLYLITGNHDDFVGKLGFDASRFQWIRPYAELSDNHRKVVLSHYPIFCYSGQNRLGKNQQPLSYMLYGHVHNTLDEVLVNRFIMQTRAEKRLIRTAAKTAEAQVPQPIPCEMINCFCMFSEYQPLTLDEWIVVDAARRSTM